MFYRPKNAIQVAIEDNDFFGAFFCFFEFFMDHVSFYLHFFFFFLQIGCYKGKHFLLFLKKMKKMKSNKKSHLINFKLILVKTNQN